MKSSMTLYPTSWTRRLQHAVLYFAVAMIIGSLLVGFVFENTTVMTAVFQRKGLSAAAAMQAASTFLVWYRLVAALFCLFYVLGAYVSWRGKTWAFWYVMLVFGVFGAGGVIFVPLQDTGLHGWGLAVSELTDGSSFLIGAILFGTYIRYRTAWAQIRTTKDEGEHPMSKHLTLDSIEALRQDSGKSHTVLLTSFRRNGQGVGTPVGMKARERKLYFMTPASSWKVRRMAHTPHVQLALCTFGGQVQSRPVDGVARRLTGPEAKQVRKWICAGLAGWFVNILFMVRYPGDKTVVYEVVLDTMAPSGQNRAGDFGSALRDNPRMNN